MEEEIIKIFNKVNSIISMVYTTLTSIFGIEWTLFAGYLVLNIIDYITGTLKAKVNKSESSKIGINGIIKKICYWVLIGIAFLISYLLVTIGKKININIDFIFLFGWFTLACLIINETRSILENLVELGIKIPDFFTKGLTIYYNKIEKNIEGKDEEEEKK